jgi:hypothetical protein
MALLALGSTGAPAEAETVKAPVPTAQVISVSKVYLVKGQPLVSGTYRCTGRLSHLWVSSKQGKGDLTQEGSGAMSRSWYQRTWDNKLQCDGMRHTRIFRLEPTGNTGRVRAAHRSYVQFCLLTGNKPADFEEGGSSSFSSSQRYRDVTKLS